MLVHYIGGKDNGGKKLKNETGWEGTGNGSDVYGFSALPGGSSDYDGPFYYLGINGCWWTSTESSPDGSGAWYIGMYSVLNEINKATYGKEFGLSLRCVKD